MNDDYIHATWKLCKMLIKWGFIPRKFYIKPSKYRYMATIFCQVVLRKVKRVRTAHICASLDNSEQHHHGQRFEPFTPPSTFHIAEDMN